MLETAVEKTRTEVYYYDTDEHSEDENFQDILDINELIAKHVTRNLINR